MRTPGGVHDRTGQHDHRQEEHDRGALGCAPDQPDKGTETPAPSTPFPLLQRVGRRFHRCADIPKYKAHDKPIPVKRGGAVVDPGAVLPYLLPCHRRASAVMTHQTPYPIGTPGQPWGPAEVAAWRSLQTRKRSYEADVLNVIERLRSRFDVVQYGRLDYPPDSYPLFAITSREWRDDLPCALVTGGVPCLETRGGHGG